MLNNGTYWLQKLFGVRVNSLINRIELFDA